VIQVVAHSGFEHRQHLGRETAPQPVCAKCAQRDSDEGGQRTDQQERPIHAADCTGKNLAKRTI
jgi:hypothetical protein